MNFFIDLKLAKGDEVTLYVSSTMSIQKGLNSGTTLISEGVGTNVNSIEVEGDYKDIRSQFIRAEVRAVRKYGKEVGSK